MLCFPRCSDVWSFHPPPDVCRKHVLRLSDAVQGAYPQSHSQPGFDSCVRGLCKSRVHLVTSLTGTHVPRAAHHVRLRPVRHAAHH